MPIILYKLLTGLPKLVGHQCKRDCRMYMNQNLKNVDDTRWWRSRQWWCGWCRSNATSLRGHRGSPVHVCTFVYVCVKFATKLPKDQLHARLENVWFSGWLDCFSSSAVSPLTELLCLIWATHTFMNLYLARLPWASLWSLIPTGESDRKLAQANIVQTKAIR